VHPNTWMSRNAFNILHVGDSVIRRLATISSLSAISNGVDIRSNSTSPPPYGFAFCSMILAMYLVVRQATLFS